MNLKKRVRMTTINTISGSTNWAKFFRNPNANAAKQDPLAQALQLASADRVENQASKKQYISQLSNSRKLAASTPTLGIRQMPGHLGSVKPVKEPGLIGVGTTDPVVQVDDEVTAGPVRGIDNMPNADEAHNMEIVRDRAEQLGFGDYFKDVTSWEHTVNRAQKLGLSEQLGIVDGVLTGGIRPPREEGEHDNDLVIVKDRAEQLGFGDDFRDVTDWQTALNRAEKLGITQQLGIIGDGLTGGIRAPIGGGTEPVNPKDTPLQPGESPPYVPPILVEPNPPRLPPIVEPDPTLKEHSGIGQPTTDPVTPIDEALVDEEPVQLPIHAIGPVKIPTTQPVSPVASDEPHVLEFTPSILLTGNISKGYEQPVFDPSTLPPGAILTSPFPPGTIFNAGSGWVPMSGSSPIGTTDPVSPVASDDITARAAKLYNTTKFAQVVSSEVPNLGGMEIKPIDISA